MRTLVLATIVLVAIVCFQGMASASEARKNWALQMLPTYENGLASATDVLTGKDQSEWTQEEVEAFLFNALCTIYTGTVIYIEQEQNLPGGSEVLRNSGIISNWPANPWNNWEFVKWENSEFVPGDCVFQVCPPELYSKSWNPRPMTFALTINGPTESYTPMNPVTKLYDWTYLPAGSVFMVGAGTQSAADQAAQKAAWEAEQEGNQ